MGAREVGPMFVEIGPVFVEDGRTMANFGSKVVVVAPKWSRHLSRRIQCCPNPSQIYPEPNSVLAEPKLNLAETGSRQLKQTDLRILPRNIALANLCLFVFDGPSEVTAM